MPEDEEVIALIDATALRTLECGLIFGEQRIYIQNARNSKSPGASRLDYSQLACADIAAVGRFEIVIGVVTFLNVVAAPKQAVLDILQAVREVILETLPEGAPQARQADESGARNSPSAVRAELANILARYRSRRGVWVGGLIPDLLRENARANCELPADEAILGLIDCSLTRTAQHALVFGENRIYLHNHELRGATPGRHVIDYDELPGANLTVGGFLDSEVSLGDIASVNISASLCPKTVFLQILREIQKLYASLQRREVGFEPPNADEITGKVVKILSEHASQPAIFVTNIPATKESNARDACEVPAEEEVLGLIDCTLFGSAKNGIVFGKQTLYFCSGPQGKQAGVGKLAYSGLGNRRIEVCGFLGAEIEIGDDFSIHVSGLKCSKQVVVDILTAIGQLFD